MLKYIKKIAAAFVVGVIMFNSSALAYDDVPYTSKYFYGIEYLRRNDVFKNTKLFKPETLISRAEFIKYLVLLNSPEFVPAKNVKLPFSDTKNSAWYAPYFDEAIKLGILDSGEKKVYPDKKVTVLDAVILLFHSKSTPIPRKYIGTIPYKDVESSKEWQGLMMRAILLGVVKPERNDFAGMYANLTRAKAAQMIYKMDLIDLRDPQVNAESQDPDLKKIIDSWNIIISEYIDRDDLEAEKLSDAAIKSMMDSLGDPYSLYMNSQNNQIFNDELGGEFEGIGAYVGIDEAGKIKIIAPIKDSPADKAGIEAGDVIKKVDDFSSEGATLNDVVTHIKGPKGSTVTLTIERGGKTMTINVKRDMITVASVKGEVIGNGDIMDIKLNTFGDNTATEFQDISELIQGNKNIKGIILDMRDNPGGYLDTAVRILNELLPKNTLIVQIKYTDYSLDQKTSSDGALKDYPIVVLVNEGSASASEIVAGALKDTGKAKIIGQKTFGKGTVQEVNYFPDNSSLKLTIAKWLTPNGTSIDKNGIEPDIAVSAGDNKSVDTQMNRAIAELKKMMK